MGNIAYTGHAMNMCGITDAVGFETSAKALINMHNIEPWDARSLIKENLQRQSELSRRSPLQKVKIQDGLEYMRTKAGNKMGLGSSLFLSGADLDKEKFVDTIVMLLGAKEVPHTPGERQDLYAVFDSMDFDKNGSLSTGEWAAGLSVFFKGSMEEAVQAVFSCLDTNKDGGISKKELQVYLSPFVKAMSPPSAAAIRPLLEKKAVDDIYYEMDMDHAADISAVEMIAWTKKGNNVVDTLADIIDKEVYQIWLAEKKKNPQRMREKVNNGQNPQDQYGNQNSQFSSGGPGGGPPGNGYGPPGNGNGPPGNGYGPPGNGYGPPGNGYGPPGNGYGPPGNGYGPPGSGPQGPGNGNEYGPGPQQAANNQNQSWLGNQFNNVFGSGNAGSPNPGNNSFAGGNPSGYGGGDQGRYAPPAPAHAPDPFANQSWDVPPPPSHPSQAGNSWGPPSSSGGGAGVPPPPAYGGGGGYGGGGYGGGSYGGPSSSPPYQSSAPYGGYR